ncbi:heme exporter protein CcmD [bacterium]|nr:heme exporter protein CcmD [bacterium]
MAEFFDMNGFGNYIWSSYGFAVICLGWLNYASWRKAKTTAEQLAILQARKPTSPKTSE